MGQQEMVLDALAWAGITEQARVARLAAMLVRQQGAPDFTQSHIKETIRNTAPPYGRAKHIFTALYGEPEEKDSEGTILRPKVEGEIERQYAIWRARKNKRDRWNIWLEYRAERATRVNFAYAAAFGRPAYEPNRQPPDEINWDWSMGYSHPNRERMEKWRETENQRDKGDICKGITHQDGHVIALVTTTDGTNIPHIVVRYRSGPITKTYLRHHADNLVEAAVSLGGPRVLAAMTKGKRVRTDWVGRRSFIYHDGSDHISPSIEEVPWLASRWDTRVERVGGYVRNAVERIDIVIHGNDERLATASDARFSRTALTEEEWASGEHEEFFVEV
ncbi:MAG: hypothetical protein AB7L09_02125 [Nitrospira sp.]